MKEQLKALLARARNQSEAKMLMREYLQAKILELLQRKGAFQSWAFLGGTALRFLYGLPRFSEDLNFSRVDIAASKEFAADSYVKGRDLYDLLWYLSDPTWPEPNLRLLQASLRQTGTELEEAEIRNWRDLAASQIRNMAWDRVIDDVSPFLERSEDIAMLTKENLLSLFHKHQS